MTNMSLQAALDAGLWEVIYYFEYLHTEQSALVYSRIVEDLSVVERTAFDYELFEYMLNHAYAFNRVSSITDFLSMARNCHIPACQLTSIITLARRFDRSVSSFITFHELSIESCQVLAQDGTPVEISRYFVDHREKILNSKVLSLLCARFEREESHKNIEELGAILCATVPASTLYVKTSTFELLLEKCTRQLRFSILEGDDVDQELSQWQEAQISRADSIISNSNPTAPRIKLNRSNVISILPLPRLANS
jgi:hypothetical protein